MLSKPQHLLDARRIFGIPPHVVPENALNARRNVEPKRMENWRGVIDSTAFGNAMENGRDNGRKHSFWRFGGKLDSVYAWLVGLILVFSCFFQIGRHHGSHLPEALGTAIGHTFVVAVVLFIVFKVISRPTKKT